MVDELEMLREKRKKEFIERYLEMEKPKLVELDKESFERVKKGIWVVDFWAPWCPPCKEMAPVIEELAKESRGIGFGKVNTDEHPEIAAEYRVMSIPTLIMFVDGKEVSRRIGAQPKGLVKEWMREHLPKRE